MQNEENVSIFDSLKAINAQKEYCQSKSYPVFAPNDGRCYHCKQDIYSSISVGIASTELITGCPHCRYSYVD